jgi:CO dehydrogenase maturation factor
MITIAISGKGGVGKTAIAALLINRLSKKGVVLAIDADPSTNLNMALGLPLKDSVGGSREQMTRDIAKGLIPPDVPKQDVLDLRIRQALVESNRIDLLAMGRPEGPGCYCAANRMLRQSIDRMANDYDYTVIDCEAGMEHISRQTTRDIDYLLVISDPTIRGIVTAAGMKKLMGELRSKVGKVYLIVNRARGELSPEIKKVIADSAMELITTIPEDPFIGPLDMKGTPVIELPDASPLQCEVAELVTKLGL